MPGEPYLDYPKVEIKKFLGENPVTALFIPYALLLFRMIPTVKKWKNAFQKSDITLLVFILLKIL